MKNKSIKPKESKLTIVRKENKHKKKRKGINAKTKSSKLKKSKLYKKTYNGQGR